MTKSTVRIVPFALFVVSGCLVSACGGTTFKQGNVTPVEATRSADGKSGTVSASDVLASSTAVTETDAGRKGPTQAGAGRELKAGSGSDLPSGMGDGADASALKNPGHVNGKPGDKPGDKLGDKNDDKVGGKKDGQGGPDSGALEPASEERKKALLAAANTCAVALGLPAETPFEHIRLVAKNVNNRTLVSDLGPRKVPALVEIDVKNANRSRIALKAPGASYCLAMDAKNANGIDIDIACDARVFVLSINFTQRGEFIVVKGRELRCAP